MGTTSLSSSTNHKPPGEFSIALSASALCAILGVTGFCWFCYYMCKRPNRTGKGFGDKKIRKSSIISVTSSTSVPGDPNGHYYKPPRNPHVYLDTSVTHGSRASSVYPPTRTHLSPVPSASSTLTGYSAKLRQQQQFSKYFNELSKEQEEQQPPPYPGERRKGGDQDPAGGQSSESAGGFVYSVLTDNKGYSQMPRLPPPYSA